MHVADDDGIQLVRVVPPDELGDDARADVDHDPAVAIRLDEIAGTGLARIRRGRRAAEHGQAHQCGCPSALAWGRRYIAVWPCDSVWNPMAAKNGTAAGVLTTATSRRSRHRSIAALASAAPILLALVVGTDDQVPQAGMQPAVVEQPCDANQRAVGVAGREPGAGTTDGLRAPGSRCGHSTPA